jgi:biotin carboxylase
MTKLLIVGGNHSDVPLIKAGILQGHEVYTTGNRPDHPGHKISNRYIPGDYSDPNEILNVARKIGADFIVPGSNDFAMISAAFVAEQMQLPGYDSLATNLLIHRKDLFKKFANTFDMPVCRNVTVDTESNVKIEDQIEALTYPLIVKPVDLTGGKGISKIDRPDELATAIKEAVKISHHKSIVIEEFFEGSLHSYSVIIENGIIIFEYFDTEMCLFQDFLVSSSISICNIHDDAKKIVRTSTQRMIKELKLVDGVLHNQFIANKNNARIIEYTRRMSGDLYSYVVNKVCGFRHEDIFISSATCRYLYPLVKNNRPQDLYVSRHCITSQHNGIFSKLIVNDEKRTYVDSIALITPFGSSVNNCGRDKVAVVISVYASESQMLDYALTLKDDFKCGITS